MTIPVPVEPTRATPPLPPAAARKHLSVVPACRSPRPFLLDLPDVPVSAWRGLRTRAIEPNAYYDPLWALPVAQHARGRGGAHALLVWDHNRDQDRLTGMMPVRWSRRALSIPGPMLVGWAGYAPLTTPSIDRDNAVCAAGELIECARKAGARALVLPGLAIGGAAYAALQQALAAQGLSAEIFRSYPRAALDATGDAEMTLRDALSPKKLKELRRQRNRLEDAGALTFQVATDPADVSAALEEFLALEASGWKGARGTALIQNEGDAAFIRIAAPALAAQRRFEVVSLSRNGATLASGLILRDGSTAYFFKIAMDETEARCSPGVQLTLDLTRYLCADPAIALADSSTDFVHPMIDHIWRQRIEIADVFIALKPRDPVAFGLKLAVQGRARAIDLIKASRNTARDIARRIREILP